MPNQFHFAFPMTSEEDSAMVFVSNEIGEHSITTRDLSVNENTIIQFEVLTLSYWECFAIYLEHNLSRKKEVLDNITHCDFLVLYKVIKGLWVIAFFIIGPIYYTNVCFRNRVTCNIDSLLSTIASVEINYFKIIKT